MTNEIITNTTATATNTTATEKAKKLTNKDFFTAFKALANGEKITISAEDVTAWCDKKIEQLARKSTAPTKPTAKQVENEKLRGIILDILREKGEFMTIEEIKASRDELAGFNPQKISALLRQLGKDGTQEVEKVLDGRVTKFAAIVLADEADETAE